MEKFTLKNLCEALPKYTITTNDQRTRIIINKKEYTRHEIQDNFADIKNLHDNIDIVNAFLLTNDFTNYGPVYYMHEKFTITTLLYQYILFDCYLKINYYFTTDELLSYLRKKLNVDSKNKIVFDDV